MPANAPILLACHGALSCNSGRHMCSLGRALRALGFHIHLATPTCSEAARQDAAPLPLHSFASLLAAPDATATSASAPISAATEAAAAPAPLEPAEPPALVHLWTPRGRMLRCHQDLCQRHQRRIPYLVHLEDNETIIARDRLPLSAAEYQAVADGRQTLEPAPDGITHPYHGRVFLQQADGITALIQTLIGALPALRPHAVFWPGYDPIFEHASPAAALHLRARLGLPPRHPVTVYTGNVHASNVAEVRSLYQALARINAAGQPLTLIRTGKDLVPLADPEAEAAQAHSIHLGEIPRAELPQLPQLLRAADLLIQPGEIDDWNRCRVPSKLPEYLASCCPVLLPHVNLGGVLTHGHNALVLDGANAERITQTVLEWLPRQEALLKIGLCGGRFARRELSWPRAAQAVAVLYQRVLNARCASSSNGAPPCAAQGPRPRNPDRTRG